MDLGIDEQGTVGCEKIVQILWCNLHSTAFIREDGCIADRMPAGCAIRQACHIGRGSQKTEIQPAFFLDFGPHFVKNPDVQIQSSVAGIVFIRMH